MKRWASFTIIICFCAVILGALTWKLNVASGVTATEEYIHKVRDGLAEINLPKTNDSSLVNAIPEGLSDFFQSRSGVSISQSNRDLLRSAEQNARNNSKEVDAAALTQILTDIALERLPTLSDTEIANITNSLRGFDAPDLPQSFQNGRSMVKLRGSAYKGMSADDFNSKLTEARNDGASNSVMQGLIYTLLEKEIDQRVYLFSQADPQFFGGTKSRMTPAQALLITYSVIADDPLFTQAEIAQRMQYNQQLGSRASGSNFPSPQGHKAFGDNGHLYSSPVSILLNDASVERLLTLVQERGN
ncbi:MAG: hypothetical protein KF762_12545 [Acidobacteria bacterium]|nr:hypothetical protein [Acidobacteriota bacterium]